MEQTRKVTTKRRKYDLRFKKEAVLLTKTKSVTEVSRQLGINENQLYKWRKEYYSQMDVSVREEMTELEALKRELKRVEMERDILKKALIIFGHPT